MPENQINNKNQSDNSAIEENTQHIHTNIYTFKRNSQSDDMLHFSKIAEIRTKFDALKSHVTCEISI